MVGEGGKRENVVTSPGVRKQETVNSDHVIVTFKMGFPSNLNLPRISLVDIPLGVFPGNCAFGHIDIAN